MSIYPLEIESVIYRHPDILEAAVIGGPDPQWGEALKALIVLKPGGKLDSVVVAELLQRALSAYKSAEGGGFRRVAATHGSGQGEQDQYARCSSGLNSSMKEWP
ncbi:MAG: AMP-binding enzyme [Candidatus Binatia bacterium]